MRQLMIIVRPLTVIAITAASTVLSLGPPAPPAAAATPGCVVDLSDAIGWWSGGDDLTAEIGPDLTGTVGFTDGLGGRGMAFDDGDDVSAAGLPTVDDGVTVEAWIKPDPAARSFAQALLARWAFVGGESDDSYALVLVPDGLIFYADTPSLIASDTVGAAVPQLYDGAFHHVAATWGGGRIVLYVDGGEVASGAARGSLLPAPTTPFRVGSAHEGGRLPYTGVLDEPAVFARALSAEEIEAIFLSGPAGKCPTGWRPEAKLVAADAADSDQHGTAVAVDGDIAVVGAPWDGGAGSASGSAYVYARQAGVWTQQAKLTSSDAAAGDLFGSSVAVSGDTIVVGAYLDDDAGNDSGSAYVFTRSGTTWTQQAKLTASDAAAGDWFATSVALDGDTAVVGAMFEGGTGSAYAFMRASGVWAQQAKLVASDASAGDRFGSDVDVSGDTAVAGAYRDDTTATDTGSAYVFVRSAGTWSQEAKVVASDAASSDWFGYSVAVEGPRAVAGAYRDDDGGPDSGAAYVFAQSGTAWAEEAKLVATDAGAADALGSTVDLSADRVVAGASLDDDGGVDAGAAYVFVLDAGTWVEEVKLVATDAEPSDWFGSAVAVDGLTTVVGAPLDDDVANATGSAYVFRLFP